MTLNNSGQQREMEDALASYSTPFKVLNTAEQSVQFSIEPQKGLTKRRYLWYSNGSLFDETLFDDTAESGIRLATTATGTDSARVHSSITGQYVAQTVAKPGMGLIFDEANVEIDENNRVSLTHGEIYAGAFWWDDVNDQIDTGIGYKWDSTGWYFFCKSQGDHLGNSPVPQSEFNIDTFDSDGPSGQVYNPANGYVYNWPYTWYNEGPFEAGILNPVTNVFEETNRFKVNGRPTTNTPNFPVQAVVRNDGTAQQLGVEFGGMQYSTYGGGIGSIEFRETDLSRVTEGQSYITPAKQLTNDSVDPALEPGVPLVSMQRETGGRDVAVAIQQLDIRPINDDIYVFQWDEWDPATALTGANFTDPVSTNSPDESKLKVDTSATDYTPTNAILRSMRFVEGGKKNQQSSAVTQRVDARVQIDATRIITAVTDGDATADVDPFIVKTEESF